MARSAFVRALALGVCVLVARVAYAQTPTVPQVVQGPCAFEWKDDKGNAQGVSNVTDAYLKGWDDFQRSAHDLLKAATDNPNTPYDPNKPCSQAAYGDTADYVQLLWVAGDAFGEKTLFSALIHEPSLPAHSTTLPGVTSVKQIFVAQKPTHELASLYTSTQQTNPLLDQIPAVAEAALNPFFALASQAMGTINHRVAARALAKVPVQAPPADAIWATVSTITLPYKRAAIDFKGVAVVEPSDTSIVKRATALGERLETNDARYSTCAKKLVSAIVDAIEAQRQVCSANTAASAKQSCIAALDEDLKSAYDTEVSACTPENATEVPKADLKALQLVDGEFRKFLTGLSPVEVNAQVKLKNVPRERYGFGLMSSLVLAGGSNKTRVKIDDNGNVVADPLSRQLSMVVLNVAFTPFDPESLTITKEERRRYFIGAVITPNFGVGGGVSFLVVRGFAVNLGGAVMGVPALKKNDTLGQPPTSSSDQFGLGIAGAVFLGASYNFK